MASRNERHPEGGALKPLTKLICADIDASIGWGAVGDQGARSVPELRGRIAGGYIEPEFIQIVGVMCCVELGTREDTIVGKVGPTTLW